MYTYLLKWHNKVYNFDLSISNQHAPYYQAYETKITNFTDTDNLEFETLRVIVSKLK